MNLLRPFLLTMLSYYGTQGQGKYIPVRYDVLTDVLHVTLKGGTTDRALL